jgi:hypothetical protein
VDEMADTIDFGARCKAMADPDRIAPYSARLWIENIAVGPERIRITKL